MPYREVTAKDWRKVALYILLALLVIAVSGWLLIPLAKPIGMIVWLAVIVAGALFFLVKWHARSTAYRCPACGQEFEISILADFISPQVPDKKYLKCPHCGRREWAAVLMKEEWS